MAQQEQVAPSEAWARVKGRLRAELGEDVFASWFRGVELGGADGEVLHLTVATRFLRNWLRSHYYDFVLRLARAEWPDIERVEFKVRQPHFGGEVPKEALRQRRPVAPSMHRGDRPANAAPHGLRRVRRLAARSAPHLHELPGRRLEPARACRGARGGTGLRQRAVAVQPAVPARQCGFGKNPPAARDLLGGDQAQAGGRGALPHCRALHVGLRAGASGARRARLQGQAAQDRYPA